MPVLATERGGNIAIVEVVSLLTRHDAGALEDSRQCAPVLATLRALKSWAFSPNTMQMPLTTSGVVCLVPVLATAQSAGATLRALKSWVCSPVSMQLLLRTAGIGNIASVERWTFSPVTMQMPAQTAGISYRSWPHP